MFRVLCSLTSPWKEQGWLLVARIPFWISCTSGNHFQRKTYCLSDSSCVDPYRLLLLPMIILRGYLLEAVQRTNTRRVEKRFHLDFEQQDWCGSLLLHQHQVCLRICWIAQRACELGLLSMVQLYWRGCPLGSLELAPLKYSSVGLSTVVGQSMAATGYVSSPPPFPMKSICSARQDIGGDDQRATVSKIMLGRVGYQNTCFDLWT